MLTRRDEENLMRAIEFSLPIRRRSQFFTWSAGILQGLLAHEVLICAHGTRGGAPSVTDTYATRPLPEMPKRLLAASHAEWRRRGGEPLLISRDGGDPSLAQLETLLETHAMPNCAVHGLPPVEGGAGSFFCFARVSGPLTRRHADLLDRVLPSLHVAYVRTLMSASTAGPATPKTVTGREAQILRWLHEGKSNREIAEILGISPYTVKNHVQSIFRKLHVKNRTQAVTRALALRLVAAQA